MLHCVKRIYGKKQHCEAIVVILENRSGTAGRASLNFALVDRPLGVQGKNDTTRAREHLKHYNVFNTRRECSRSCFVHNAVQGVEPSVKFSKGCRVRSPIHCKGVRGVIFRSCGAVTKLQ